MNIDDCFQVLELRPDATLEEIKAARNELLQVWHPDKYGSNSKLSAKAKEKTLKINEAFNILVEDRKTNGAINKSKRQKSSDADDFQKELEHYSKKQKALLKYQDKLNNQKIRARRQLNFTLLFTVLAGIFGWIVGLMEWTFALVLLVLLGGLLLSFWTYWRPVRKNKQTSPNH